MQNTGDAGGGQSPCPPAIQHADSADLWLYYIGISTV